LLRSVSYEKKAKRWFLIIGAHAAAELIEAIRDALIRGRSAGTVVTLKRVQSGPVHLEEQAAVIFVRAVLRNDFDLGA